MTTERRLILGAYYLFPSSHYSELWRHPYSETDYFSRGAYERLARFLEDAGFDLAFIPESLAAPRGDDGSWARGVAAGEIGAVRHEPSSLAQVITSVTERLAVGVTLSTTFWSPYQIARLFSSLNHFSGGRVAWNIITSGGDDNARSFGLPQLPEHDSRYAHAGRVVEAAVKLWDSWDDDAVLLDKKSGLFADASKIREVHYDRDDVKVDSVLSLPPAPGGGRPVFIQAGESPAGREFAAEWAQLVFSIQNTAENLKSLRDDVRERAVRHGRHPDSVKLLAAIIPVIGETDEIARERSAYLTSLIQEDRAARKLARSLGVDVPTSPGTKVVDVVEDPVLLPIRIRRVFEELGTTATFGELALHVARSSSTAWVVGSAETVADLLTEFFASGSVDGFIITPTHFPGSFEEFGRSVIPILRERGLVRDPLQRPDVSFRHRL